MSDVSQRRVRLHVLAAATAIALSSMAAGGVFAADRVNLSGLDSSATYDRFIVKYRDGSSARADAAVLKASLDNAARAVPARQGKPLAVGHLRRLAVGADVVKSDRKLDRAEAESLMRQIAADPNVEYVEVDALMQPLMSPNDTRYNEQWHYFEATGGLNVPTAWDKATGTGTVVAVIDTGITTHSDLGANVVAGYDFISDTTVARDGNGRDSDPSDPGDSTTGQSSWHGTHVAGTVAAVTNNAKGVAGVAFNAKIMPIRVLGVGGGYTSDIADGIIWSSGGAVSGVPANSNPAEVINMSLGGSGACGATTQSAIDGAVSRGTVVVVAAGNSNADVANFNPANCNNVIAVASNDRQGNRASYSNYGAKIDVTAPGGETATTANGVLSTLNAGTTSPGAESYAFYQGTSMAAPHVAGVAALMQSVKVQTPATVESQLKSTARALPGTCSGGCGSGIVNASAAVDAALGTTPPPTGGTLTKGVAVTNLSATTGNSVNYTMSVPAGASNLTFTMSGGTGDADMYVKFGSAPTDTVYDCRPYLSGNAESCTFAAPSAGTYYVRLKAYSSFSGVSLVGDYSTGGGGSQTYTNSADYTISDNATVESPISVSGRTGSASSSTPVAVNIVHTYIGDLKVDLVAPDGSIYVLHNRSGGSADNINTTYTVNLSTEALNGTWKLRVNDNAAGDVGYINSWSITF
jgi:serine protease